MPLVMRFTARSHVGRVREGNEDSAYVGPHLLALADGMGGHAAGEVASAAAITAFTSVDADEVPDPAARLAEAVAEADENLRLRVADDAAREGMGTTLTALYWDGSGFTLAHVGDSRAYRLRDGQLEQISHDHTFVQTLVDEGRLSPEEAHAHPQRSLILRALDGRGRVEPDIERFDAAEGDRYLVCSDGLSDYVSYGDIAATVLMPDLDAAADRLIELALAAGAPDNVTVLLAEIADSDDTGVLPPTNPDDHHSGLGLLVGAVAEDEAQRAAAAATAVGSTERPDRRLHDPEEETEDYEAELARYAPQPPSRFRWFRRAVILLVVVGVVVGIGYAGLQWTRTQYYVGVQDDQVAIYQGIEQRVVGLSLSEVYEVYEVPIDTLPTFDRTAIEETISADSLDDARSIADRLRMRAETCERFRKQAAEEEDDQGSATDPTTDPTTSSPGQSTPPATTTAGGTAGATTGGAGAGTSGTAGATTGAATGATTGPDGQPTTSPTESASATADEATTSPGPDEEPDFDDPVTREECGVDGS